MSLFWEQQLADIREQLLMMSGLTERNLALAMRALVERDDKLCDTVEAEDSQIDHLEIQIDEMVITYIATHGPIARDCRMMLTTSKIANNLERIADQATKIARRSRELNTEPLLKPLIDIPLMADIAQEMLRDSITAFVDGNHELAVEIIARDRSVDSINKQLERELTGYMVESPKTITRALNLMTVAKAIERVADHATNIAEEVFYLYKGQDIRHEPSFKQPASSGGKAKQAEQAGRAARHPIVTLACLGWAGCYACGVMSALQRIFGRDTKFFDLLEGSAAAAKQSATSLVAAFPKLTGNPSSEVLGDLAQARRKHKRLSQETTEELCKNFVTPLEREDIEALSTALYKISKNVEKIGERLLISPSGTDLGLVSRQITMLERAAEVVVIMVNQLRAKSHGEDIRDAYEKLQTIEGDADKLMTELLRELYHGTSDARSVVFWKDLYELLEKGIDRCRDAGYVVFHVALKYS